MSFIRKKIQILALLLVSSPLQILIDTIRVEKDQQSNVNVVPAVEVAIGYQLQLVVKEESTEHRNRINLELGTVVSTRIKVIHSFNSLEIPQPVEIGVKSNLSLMMKEEQGEEVLALPSPGTLNDMMSKVQKLP
uniref:YbbR-like protein n=1 Tax=Loa loa TaxID=7209 RepID=A0A1I7VH49_LOALO